MTTETKDDVTRSKSAEYIYKDLTYKIIGAVYEVHKELGSVHKEVIYHRALALEFKEKNIPFVEEKAIELHTRARRSESTSRILLLKTK